MKERNNSTLVNDELRRRYLFLFLALLNLGPIAQLVRAADS